MKILLLSLALMSSVCAYEIEWLHMTPRVKSVAPELTMTFSGSLNGLRLQCIKKVAYDIRFDQKKSFALRPSGIKAPLEFISKDKRHRSWSCRFKDDIFHANMEQGVFEFHLHFTMNGKSGSYVHKLKYTTRGKGMSLTRGVQKEQG